MHRRLKSTTQGGAHNDNTIQSSPVATDIRSDAPGSVLARSSRRVCQRNSVTKLIVETIAQIRSGKSAIEHGPTATTSFHSRLFKNGVPKCHKM